MPKRPIPEGKRAVRLIISTDVYGQAQAAARAQGVSASEWIRRAVVAALDAEEADPRLQAIVGAWPSMPEDLRESVAGVIGPACRGAGIRWGMQDPAPRADAQDAQGA